jgi:hypothetical protein
MDFTPLPPTQFFFLISTLAILPIAWFKGGHPERAGVALLLVGYVAALFMRTARAGEFMFGYALVDLGFLVVLGWMTLKYDRWWLLVATAAQVLTVLTYLAVLTRPGLTARENVVAAWLFGLILLYTLLGGVLERWLAGEPATATALLARSVRGNGVRARS